MAEEERGKGKGRRRGEAFLCPRLCASESGPGNQVAARAQRRTVSEEEVVRYETYNDVHGAKLVSQTESQEDIMAEDNW